jgi:toxin ParE1/3/4
MTVHQFTPTASRDLERIMDYLADVSGFDAAEKFLVKLNKKCHNLANFPSLGRQRSELSPGLRSYAIETYLIFYRSIDGGIEIMRVVSGYQDLSALFDDVEES